MIHDLVKLCLVGGDYPGMVRKGGEDEGIDDDDFGENGGVDAVPEP